MKNITVAVDEETYRLARIEAKEAGTSVSELVRFFLVRWAEGSIFENRFDRLRRLQDDSLESIRAHGAGLDSAENLSRDALHDRMETGGQESPPSEPPSKRS